METLKKLFPYSFKAKKDIGDIIVNIIVYLVVGFIAGALIGFVAPLFTGILGIIGWAIGIVGALVDFYVLVGIILFILDYLKVLK